MEKGRNKAGSGGRRVREAQKDRAAETRGLRAALLKLGCAPESRIAQKARYNRSPPSSSSSPPPTPTPRVSGSGVVSLGKDWKMGVGLPGPGPPFETHQIDAQVTATEDPREAGGATSWRRRGPQGRHVGFTRPCQRQHRPCESLTCESRAQSPARRRDCEACLAPHPVLLTRR